MFSRKDLIHSYTRADAIDDGLLIDVSHAARQAGFIYPVAVTAAVWERTVAWPVDKPRIQDEKGRLWDVLFLARTCIKCQSGTTSASFIVSVINPDTNNRDTVKLIVQCGPGDSGEPVITIMLPDED